MLTVRTTTRFVQDLKKLSKKHKIIDLLESVIKQLEMGQRLSIHYRDHNLIGNWKGYRECHIESDWLLIYLIKDTDLILVRTGSQDELFSK